MEKELTPKQQVSEAIRNAQTILIITGQRPTVDQATGAMATAMMLRKFGKKVTAIISDQIPAGASFLDSSMIDRELGGQRDFIVELDLSSTEVDKLKYTIENGKLNVHITPYQGGFSQRDVSFAYGEYHFDLVIAVGVANYDRLDGVYAANQQALQSVPLLNIDYHRSNQNYGAVNHIDTNAASLGEMLMAMSESLQTGLVDEKIATALLTGIMSATDRFTAPGTTPKSLTVAAQMMAMGAQQSEVVKGLYRKDTNADRSSDRGRNQQQSRTQQQSIPQPVAAQIQPAPMAQAPQQMHQPASQPEVILEPEHVIEAHVAPAPEIMSQPVQTPQTDQVHQQPAANPANRPTLLQAR